MGEASTGGATAPQDNPPPVFSVRFTARDGLTGWLQAVLARQRFYGEGRLQIEVAEILLQGWQRTWLAVAQQSEIAIPTDAVQNVYADGDWVAFDVKRRWWLPRRYAVRTSDAVAAGRLAALLPTARSKWFERQSTDIRSFYRLLRSPGHRPWLTALLVLACCLIYLAQALTSGGYLVLDSVTLVSWGANVGALTLGGAWWRLASAIFLHIGLLHLAVNMWVLWSVGRLAEGLFGNRSFALLFLFSGLFANLLSLAWNPVVSSVGASGAIFGVLGALIAYFLHGGTRIPRSVIRAHLIPTVLFTLFSIVSGLAQNGVDNTAHVGGLFGGFVLGWALACPVGRDMPRATMLQGAGALLLFLAAFAALMLQVTGPLARPAPSQQFVLANRAYTEAEARNLQAWLALAAQAGAGTISDSDLGAQFEKNIIPFWRGAVPTLRKALAAAPAEQKPFAQAALTFATLRLEWARAIVAAVRGGDRQKMLDLSVKATAAQAELEWHGLRAGGEKMTASLANAPPAAAVMNLVWYNYRPCARDPIRTNNPIAPSDSRSDGPARGEALACRAQHLFLTRDFATLDAEMTRALARLYDLPDGASSYEALHGGLDAMFSFGNISVDTALERLAAWRKAAPGSVHAQIAEVSMLYAWAYGARGYGYADTITQQNQQLFSYRIEMARAALRAMERRAANNPLWYSLSIGINLMADGSRAERQALFERGRARFPDFLALHAAMMRSLMPRWGGSYEDVGRFILSEVKQPERAMPFPEKYARLYWIYARQEGPDTDIFKQAYAQPDAVLTGMAMAVKRRPQRDYVLNMAARMACMVGDRAEYRVFSHELKKRYSASAWSPDFTVEQCNKKLDSTP